MLKSDKWIIGMAEKYGMIEPFVKEHVKAVDGRKVLSYGLCPYAYELRLSEKFYIPKPHGSIIDSKYYDFNDVYVKGNPISIPPKEYIVGFSVERFKIPKCVVGFVFGKLSLISMGIMIDKFFLEPGFRGQLRLQIINLNSVPVKIYPLEGIARILFFENNSD